jgi:hypothetical protein
MTKTLDTAAASVAQSVNFTREGFITIDDFPEYSRGAVARALSRHVERGEVLRIRRGLYWRGVETNLGVAAPSPWQIMKAIYGPDAPIGPARLDAAGALGLTTQLAARPTFAVPYLTEGLSFMLINRDRRRGRQSSLLNRFEIALLEIADDWPGLVEVSTRKANAILADHIRSGILRPALIAQACDTEPPRVRDVIRDVMEDTQQPEALQRIRTTAPIMHASHRSIA